MHDSLQRNYIETTRELNDMIIQNPDPNGMLLMEREQQM